MKLTEREMLLVRAGRLEGELKGITDYAVWKDGEQLVGVMRRPLKEVTRPLRDQLDQLYDQIENNETEH